MKNIDQALKKVFFDVHFLTALLLGPLVWLALYLWVRPAVSVTGIQMLLMVCLIYPVLEELAFRGFVQTWLLEKPQFAQMPLTGLSYANVATSILFAGAHLLNQSLFWAVSIFFPSLVFGYFRDRYDLVWPSIILHCWYNTGFFLLLR
jgi:membrane protease YdiL (CAAX protease family)